MRRNMGPDTWVHGCKVPSGAYVVYPFSDVHLDPELYPDPWRFDPGRPEQKVPFAYVGWGGGEFAISPFPYQRLGISLPPLVFVLLVVGSRKLLFLFLLASSLGFWDELNELGSSGTGDPFVPFRPFPQVTTFFRPSPLSFRILPHFSEILIILIHFILSFCHLIRSFHLNRVERETVLID